MTVIEELESDHEETDTRLILHAFHAHNQQYPNIILHSPDTDVAIIALHFASSLSDSVVYMATGVGNKKCIISITGMATILGKEFTDALPGVHAVSGCDTVSSFHGKGKRTCFTLRKEEPYTAALGRLGESFQLGTDVIGDLEKFVCRLYKAKTDKVDDARYELFCSSTPEERCLPPNKDCLIQHLKRANYQARIWRLSSNAKMNVPLPSRNYGWLVKDNSVQILWMEGDPAPPNVLKNTFCSCKVSKCAHGRCSCLSEHLKCTELCQCGSECENQSSDDDDNGVLQFEADDSDSDIE